MTRDRTQPLHLRVFIASPGDVAQERAAAREIVDRLPQDPLLRGRVTTQSVAWGEPGGDLPLPATSSPQAAIAAGLPRPRDCDLCLVILWARMGTPLDPTWETKPDGTPYVSGTEWEFLDARAGHAEHGRPEILIYRRAGFAPIDPRDPARAQEQIAQFQAVETFCAQLKNPDGSWSGAVNGYSEPDDFSARLMNDLKAVVERLLVKADGPDSGGGPSDSKGAQGGDRIAASPTGIAAGTVSDSALVTGNGNVVILGPTQVHTGPAAPDTGHLERAYLEQLARVSRRLERQGGSGASLSGEERTRLKLDAVYTALLTRTPRADPEPKGRGRKAARPEDSAPEARPPLSALEMLDRERRLVLLGEAGSGKSTFLDFVALCLAGERLVRDHGADDLPGLGLLTAPLPGDDGEPGETPQPWRHGPRLPGAGDTPTLCRRVPLARVRPHRPAHRRRSALGLYRQVPGRDPGGLRGAAQAPPAEGRRLDPLRRVGRGPEGTRASAGPAGHRWIHGQLRPLPGSHRQSHLFLPRRRLASGWIRRNGAGQPGPGPDPPVCPPLVRPCRGARRLLPRSRHWLGRGPGAGHLRPRPAPGSSPSAPCCLPSWPACTNATVGSSRTSAPRSTRNRSSCSWRTGSSRGSSWGREGQVVLCQPSLTEFLNVGSRQIRGLLERLALAAHERQSPEEGGSADIEARELADGLADLPGKRPESPPNDRLLLDYLRNRSGILTLAPKDGCYRFPHRSFQEYMAACALAGLRRGEGEIAQRVRTAPERWREVALLAAARARLTQGFVWRLAGKLCADPPPTEGEGMDRLAAWCARVAGEVLNESAELDDLEQDDAAALDRVRTWLVRLLRADTFPAAERAAIGRLLANLGDPRLEVMDPDAMQFCWVPPGPLLMGSGDDDDLAFADEKPRRTLDLGSGYWMARYPVTVAQFRRFVESEPGFSPGDPDCVREPDNWPVRRVSLAEALAFLRLAQPALA